MDHPVTYTGGVQTEGNAWLESAKSTHQAFKAQVALEAAKQAKTIAELAKQFQIHPVQISQWKKQLLDGMETLVQNGSAARQPDHEKIQTELYEQIGRLQMELAWVKKICLVKSRPSGP